MFIIKAAFEHERETKNFSRYREMDRGYSVLYLNGLPSTPRQLFALITDSEGLKALTDALHNITTNQGGGNNE